MGTTGPVIELPHPCVRMSGCLRHRLQIFLGLSCGLGSHDQFQAIVISYPAMFSLDEEIVNTLQLV